MKNCGARSRTVSPAIPHDGTHAPNDSPVGAFPIVGIGASAGGLEAFSTLLKHLPRDTGMGFVFVQHLDPEHESALTQLLARATSLPVQEVTNKLRVEPNHVYVIPPNTNLSITAGLLTLTPRPKTRAPHRSIDVFLEALAADQRERAIGVILSGTASDGTLGLAAIKAEGGITFAQDDSARYDSMPRSAEAAGCVDFILSPGHIATELARIAKHPALITGSSASATSTEHHGASAAAPEQNARPFPSGPARRGRTGADTASSADAEREVDERIDATSDDGFKKVLLLLRNYSSVDFSMYKSNTIQRRIIRRMVLTKHDTPEHYAQFLRGNIQELAALYSDVLISVTSFFRNPDAFNVLQRKVWPAVLAQPGDQPLRVWTLGCSTGEEAYSLAMSFVEASDKASRMRKLHVFATDLNDTLLDKARHGLYAKTIAQDLSPERLRRFFVEEEGGYRISKALREMIVFARQNVLGDPPFSRLDLISCRNLLIYFEPGLQKKLFPVFHYALKPGGFLYLGASESIGNFTDLFEPSDTKHKIYAKKAGPTPTFHLPRRDGGKRSAPPAEDPVPSQLHVDRGEANDLHAERSAQREADRVAVHQFAPPAVLINADLQILQFRGPTAAYLEPPTGKASFDVLKMARPGLLMPLRSVINKAKKDNRTARKENVRIGDGDHARTINVEVIPLKNLRERCFLVVFEDADLGEPASTTTRRRRRRVAPPPAPVEHAFRAESRRQAALEAELAETRDYVQTIQEQYEAANEELQASNEEVQSANEELQSINEELETSKEELESANEELTTLNEEMANRNAELNRLNSDLVNIETSAHLAIMLLGRDLTIRRFSVQAEKQFHLLAADVGRPISHVRHNLGVPDLEPFITEVIDSVRAREREVQDKDGRWFSLRVRPYLTVDNKVDGATLVLVDISDLKRNEIAIASARAYAENVVGTLREPVLVLDPDLRVESVNRAFYQTFSATPHDTIGKFIYDLGNRQWDIPELRRLLEEILPQSHTIEDFLVEANFERLGRRTMRLNARRMHNPGGIDQRIVLAVEDVTDRNRTEEKLRESEGRYRTLFDLGPVAVYSCDAAGVIQKFNRRAAELWGREPVPGDTSTRFCGSFKMFRPDGRLLPHEECPMAEVVAGVISEVRDAEVVIERPGGFRVTVVVNILPLKNQEGDITGAINCFYDITERKRAEEAIRSSDRRKNEFLAMLAHELRNPLAPILVSIEILRRAKNGEGSSHHGSGHADASAASEDVGSRVDHALEVLQRQVGQMVRLVDDLLDAGRIGGGKIDLRRERVELASVVYHVLDAVRPIADSRAQELTVTLPAEPVYLDADPTRLAQIVGNLLNNAIKFTDRRGHIWLTVESDERSVTERAEGQPHQSDCEVVIRVRDTGIGIAADQLEHVFDMFAQVDTSLERSLSGLGIGLTLVKALTELHGGTVKVRSTGLGQGSEFIVRLPIEAGTVTRPFPSIMGELAPVTPLRVLIVDDNRDATDMLAMLLKLRGNEILTAHDGEAAVKAAAAFDPDVILLDLGLPVLNGYEAARRIREQRGSNRRPVLVALTGWGQDEDRRRSEEAGFDAHIVKPVDDAVLARLFAELDAGSGQDARLAHDDGHQVRPEIGSTHR